MRFVPRSRDLGSWLLGIMAMIAMSCSLSLTTVEQSDACYAYSAPWLSGSSCPLGCTGLEAQNYCMNTEDYYEGCDYARYVDCQEETTFSGSLNMVDCETETEQASSCDP